MDHPESPGQDPLSVAVEWASRIIAASLVMIGPAILVDWLFDSPLLTLTGLLAGMGIGLTYLISITKAMDRKGSRGSSNGAGRDEPSNHE